MTDQNPDIGRIVRYILSQADVAQINARRAANDTEANPVAAGMEFAAIVVAIGGNDDSGFSCNLKVQLDGRDTLWQQGPEQGYQPGQWHWPNVS
jgi:hypothetical protein